MFLSSSLSSPFAPKADLSLTSNSTDTTLSAARGDRSWFDFNHGNIFDPLLNAYSPSAQSAVSQGTDRVGGEAGSDTTALQSTSGSGLPAGYWDLRWRGLGIVLNVNPFRSEEGLLWEGYRLLPKAAPSASSTEGETGEAGEAAGQTSAEMEQELVPVPSGEVEEAPEQQDQKELMEDTAADPLGGLWTHSFLGSW